MLFRLDGYLLETQRWSLLCGAVFLPCHSSLHIKSGRPLDVAKILIFKSALKLYWGFYIFQKRCLLFLFFILAVVDNSSNWAVCGKSSGVISMPVAARATHKVHMEVMPLFAGYLPFPDVRLFKYLPHHSAHSMQLDAGKAILTTWLLTEMILLLLCSCVKRKVRRGSILTGCS